MENVTVVSLAAYLEDPSSEEAQKDIQALVNSFVNTSALIARDPRVTYEDNTAFLDTMERYYDQPLEKKLRDVRPEYHHQVGATPELTELPRDHRTVIDSMENKPILPEGPDPKWRFFWRAGERPETTEYADLNMPQIIPADFPEWPAVMDRWANLMLTTVETVSEMLAVGLGLDKDAFTRRMKLAPHLLAPTGSDLNKYSEVGTALAGFHYDLNFLTIHGKSRFPGLHVWLRSGEKVRVSVPDGCLLLQAGKQLEWLTGASITAGFHEVVVLEETLKACEKAKQENRPLWRVSSTLFSHIASDEILEPLKPEWKDDKYPAIKAGEQVREELRQIKLAKE